MPKLLKVTALYSPHGAAALVELISCIYFKPSLRLVSLGHLWAHVSSKISYLCISTFYITSSLTPEIVCWCKMTPCPPAKAANQKWGEIGFPYSSLWYSSLIPASLQPSFPGWLLARPAQHRAMCVISLPPVQLDFWPQVLSLKEPAMLPFIRWALVTNPQAKIVTNTGERGAPRVSAASCASWFFHSQSRLFILEGACNIVQREQGVWALKYGPQIVVFTTLSAALKRHRLSWK